jgi:hypothetical protein
VTEHEASLKNIVARDGSDRQDRHECNERWATRMEGAGFGQALGGHQLGLRRDGLKVCTADGASICVLRGGRCGRRVQSPGRAALNWRGGWNRRRGELRAALALLRTELAAIGHQRD